MIYISSLRNSNLFNNTAKRPFLPAPLSSLNFLLRSCLSLYKPQAYVRMYMPSSQFPLCFSQNFMKWRTMFMAFFWLLKKYNIYIEKCNKSTAPWIFTNWKHLTQYPEQPIKPPNPQLAPQNPTVLFQSVHISLGSHCPSSEQHRLGLPAFVLI